MSAVTSQTVRGLPSQPQAHRQPPDVPGAATPPSNFDTAVLRILTGHRVPPQLHAQLSLDLHQALRGDQLDFSSLGAHYAGFARMLPELLALYGERAASLSFGENFDLTGPCAQEIVKTRIRTIYLPASGCLHPRAQEELNERGVQVLRTGNLQAPPPSYEQAMQMNVAPQGSAAHSPLDKGPSPAYVAASGPVLEALPPPGAAPQAVARPVLVAPVTEVLRKTREDLMQALIAGSRTDVLVLVGHVRELHTSGRLNAEEAAAALLPLECPMPHVLAARTDKARETIGSFLQASLALEWLPLARRVEILRRLLGDQSALAAGKVLPGIKNFRKMLVGSVVSGIYAADLQPHETIQLLRVIDRDLYRSAQFSEDRFKGCEEYRLNRARLLLDAPGLVPSGDDLGGMKRALKNADFKAVRLLAGSDRARMMCSTDRQIEGCPLDAHWDFKGGHGNRNPQNGRFYFSFPIMWLKPESFKGEQWHPEDWELNIH